MSKMLVYEYTRNTTPKYNFYPYNPEYLCVHFAPGVSVVFVPQLIGKQHLFVHQKCELAIKRHDIDFL